MVGIRDDSMNNRIANIQKELIAFKSTPQPIAGDSWVPYEYSGSYSIPSGSPRYLIFTQDDLSRVAVVRPSTDPVMSMYSIPFIPQGGVHVFYMQNSSGITISMDYLLYSTVKGTVSLSSSPPF